MKSNSYFFLSAVRKIKDLTNNMAEIDTIDKKVVTILLQFLYQLLELNPIDTKLLVSCYLSKILILIFSIAILMVLIYVLEMHLRIIH